MRPMYTFARFLVLSSSIALLAIVPTGCRTAGPTVRISRSCDVRIYVTAHTEAAQGKTVPVDIARAARLQAEPLP